MLPSVLEFVLVQFSPFSHHPQRSCRKTPCDQARTVDTDDGFAVSIDGVKVWRIVVPPMHVDHNSVEGADPGHAGKRRRMLIRTGRSLTILSVGVGPFERFGALVVAGDAGEYLRDELGEKR